MLGTHYTTGFLTVQLIHTKYSDTVQLPKIVLTKSSNLLCKLSEEIQKRTKQKIAEKKSANIKTTMGLQIQTYKCSIEYEMDKLSKPLRESQEYHALNHYTGI